MKAIGNPDKTNFRNVTKIKGSLTQIKMQQKESEKFHHTKGSSSSGDT